MGRAPCCEKMGMKKGPWTPEEDQILINYINTYGHANWRALPKHAGLLRCGKSCRLRWTNYLKPDIKRGNFTKEEEDAIIDLHEMLGNRWSAIAARLGRTDNEIKNVWHTHLKKRLLQNQQRHHIKPKPKQTESNQEATKHEQQDSVNLVTTKDESTDHNRPQCSSDHMSTLTMTSDDSDHNSSTTHNLSINNNNDIEYPENNLALDEDFWSEVLSSDNSNETHEQQFQIPLSPLVNEEVLYLASSSSMCDNMDFWYDVYARADELTTESLELS